MFEEYITQATYENLINGATAEEQRFIRAWYIKTNCVARFRSLDEKQRDKTLNALKLNRLYFSTALGYNDPYDTLMYVNYDLLFRNIYLALQYGMDSYITEIKKKDYINGCFIEALWSSLNSQKEEKIELFFTFVKDTIEEIKHKMRANIKGICFSQNCLSTLMWAHYANDHKGIALLYDRQELPQAKCYDKNGTELQTSLTLESLNYGAERFDATKFIEEYILKLLAEGKKDRNGRIMKFHDVPNYKDLKGIILTKDESWHYEKEVRLIPRRIDFEHTSDLVYVSIKPKAIIMGAKILDTDKEAVIDLSKKLGCTLYEAWIDDSQREYKIVFQENGYTR